MPVMLLLLHPTLLRDLLLPLRLCLFLPESLVILMLLLLPEMLHFILLLAALHLAVAPTLHGPALSVHLGAAWSPGRPSNFHHGLIVRPSAHALIISIDLMMALSLICVTTG